MLTEIVCSQVFSDFRVAPGFRSVETDSSFRVSISTMGRQGLHKMLDGNGRLIIGSAV